MASRARAVKSTTHSARWSFVEAISSHEHRWVEQIATDHERGLLG
jgi:hypothetical protein